jgi:hypothetical protein
MDKPESPSGETHRAAQLILTLDLETSQLTIAGTVPSHDLALDMARRAVDECKRIIDKRWNEQNAPKVVRASAPNALFPRGSSA